MTENYVERYEPFFGKWRIKEQIGRGALGPVYEIYNTDSKDSEVSALKFMHIPSEESLQYWEERYQTREFVRTHFAKQVEYIEEEIRMIRTCRGHENIVGYINHNIIDYGMNGEIGWDILLQVERLYPISSQFGKALSTQYDVVKMWLDIANALRCCEENNIIHRDIKPLNIMVSQGGSYKLADFGIATQGQRIDESTIIGTENFMAPEIRAKKKYDKRVDYYSLGCTVYYLLNHKRHVFCPAYPKPITPMDMENANYHRHSGKKVPPIPWVSKEINKVLLKSMAYAPWKRYKDAEKLYKAIKKILDIQEDELRKKLLNPV